VSTGAQNFISSAWPELLTLILFIFFVLLAWRLGSRALGKLRGLGR
jgi:hypothetical protein